MTTRAILLGIGLIGTHLLAGQTDPKVYTIQKTSTPPIIDGLGDDAVWNDAEIGTDFRMLEPENGPLEPLGRKTEVKLAYDDEAIYVFARMHDPQPDSILRQLSARDNYNVNTDWFALFINPFNDGLNDFSFHITAAGVQTDGRNTDDGNDRSWNTVWESEVNIDEYGWTVELRIPYQCLRFPEKQGNDWGLNVVRYVRRTRQMYTWNFIDRSTSTYELQAGLLRGMVDIDPPVRLSFMPYLSGYQNMYPDGQSQSANFGMDLKYGISESFTLDATLIPDFGQVAFDQQFLNIGPFENQFQENRQFFVEGTELFSKGDMFYSRRIGGNPKNLTNADASSLDNLTQDYTRLLNATKVSGRTSGNLGIGVLNAITDNNYLEGQDSLGNEVRILTEPLTNYNVFVLDQRINRNRSISVVNTNVLREGNARDANVTALIANLNNDANSYNFYAQGNMSAIFQGDSNITDFSTAIQISKIDGNWRWGLSQEYVGDEFDKNDLGFQARNNLVQHYLEGSYQVFQPVGNFNRYRITLGMGHRMLASNGAFENFVFESDFFAVTRNFFAFGGGFSIRPVESQDYFEPRREGYRFTSPRSAFFTGWISSDYRKPFAIDSRISYEAWDEYGYRFYLIGIKPIVRASDRWTFFYDFVPRVGFNNVGWATSTTDSVIFGRRDITTVEQTFGSTFTFTPTMSLSLNFRHYWRALEYKEYYNLNTDGTLDPLTDDYGRDLNFNTLNVDLKFSWWFAPGSEVVLLYRNSLISNEEIDGRYLENLRESLETPSTHIFSIRLTYFLDYATLAR